MGCWNGTCGLSQMPINAGDPVMVFLISENAHRDKVTASNFCGAVGEWDLFSFPVEAKYNDYGGFDEVVMNPYFEKSFEQLRSMLVEKTFKESDYKSYPGVLKESFDLEILNDAIHDDELHIFSKYVTLGGKKLLSVGHFMVHKCMYDAAIEKYSNRRYELMKERSARTLEKLKKINNDDTIGALTLAMMAVDTLGINWTDIPYIRSILNDSIVKNLSLPEPDLRALSDVIGFMDFMDSVRRAFRPQQGAGSQDNGDGYEDYKLLHGLSDNIINLESSRYEDD